mmetsp:Transcript_118850/g.177655  ORF Transcript_118850/g.177655 Transcript_118850/m.177655 type:complete len:103 (-) Transcript_118850:14-322(-)
MNFNTLRHVGMKMVDIGLHPLQQLVQYLKEVQAVVVVVVDTMEEVDPLLMITDKLVLIIVMDYVEIIVVNVIGHGHQMILQNGVLRMLIVDVDQEKHPMTYS